MWTRPDGHGGQDNPAFIAHMHDFINDPTNNVAYHNYFDYDGDDGRHRLSSLPAGGARFQVLFGPS